MNRRDHGQISEARIISTQASTGVRQRAPESGRVATARSGSLSPGLPHFLWRSPLASELTQQTGLNADLEEAFIAEEARR
jgi:hypothetical protein